MMEETTKEEKEELYKRREFSRQEHEALRRLRRPRECKFLRDILQSEEIDELQKPEE